MADEPLDGNLHRVTTADGSATLHHPRFAQTYHSSHGALKETRHVFLGLSRLEDRLTLGPVSVLEVGVGTGLNLIAAVSLARAQGAVLHYTGIEREPQPAALLRTLEFGALPGIDAEVWEHFLHAIDARATLVELPGGSTLRFHWDDLDRFDFDAHSFDVVFHDGFSPEMNPEVWTSQALQKITAPLKPGGCLVTYTVQGDVRRALASIGLLVERLPGPTDGKRQVLRATKA